MKPELIAALIRVAHQDVTDAKALGRERRNAYVLLEQSTEKVFLAILTSEDLQADRTLQHQLRRWLDRVPDENPLKVRLAALAHLQDYATTYRYPSATGKVKAPPTDRFEAWARAVTELVVEAATAFGVDLAHESAPARSTAPLRSR